MTFRWSLASLGPPATVRVASGDGDSVNVVPSLTSTDKSVCAHLRRHGGERPARIAENAVRPDALLVQLVEEHRLQDAEAVTEGAPESDLRGFVEIARRDRNLADAHPFGHTLGDDLRIENEVVGVRLEVDGVEVALRI